MEKYINCLKNDGVLAYPTDTVYGLCVRFDHIEASNKLRNVKNRPKEKSFPIMVSDIVQLDEIAELNAADLLLIRSFMPGPITLILPKKDIIQPWMNDNRDTIAVRMACDEILSKIIKEVGVPLFMTSANKSGEPCINSFQEIRQQLEVDEIYEGIPKQGVASTIVDCTNNYKVVRKGPISQEMVDNLLSVDEAVKRIIKMEAIFDQLVAIEPSNVIANKTYNKLYQELLTYYYKEWQYDYDLDSKHLIPQDLKRGILSEDAIYDLISAIN